MARCTTHDVAQDDVAISEAERQKIEEAVEKYMASERERQEDFRECRAEGARTLLGVLASWKSEVSGLVPEKPLREQLLWVHDDPLPDQLQPGEADQAAGGARTVTTSTQYSRDPSLFVYLNYCIFHGALMVCACT